MSPVRFVSACLFAVGVCGVFGPACEAQAKPKLPPEPTFNLFTPAQDIEIGRASAKEADRQLGRYVDPPLELYVNRLVKRLAAVAPGAKYPYMARIINAPEINAFSMPGGPIYVTRGALIETQTEPEVAAILAHEMAHIALRHGTDHASKLYLGKSGLGLLGGLRGKRSHQATEMINEVGGVGLNLAFLRFFDDDEYEADAAAARMLARAGYDPGVMTALQARVRATRRRDSVASHRFFADHPPGESRDERLRAELGALSLKPASEIGGFGDLRARLAASPAAKQLEHPWPTDSASSDAQKAEPVVVRLPAPGTKVAKFRQRTGFFTLSYPADWQVHDSTPGFGVAIAPTGGILDLPNGAQTVAQGVIVNHYAPFETDAGRFTRGTSQQFAPLTFTNNRPRGTLENATEDIVRLVMWTNPYLLPVNGSAYPERIDGAMAYSVTLTGLSPLIGEEERVLLYTRILPDNHVVFVLCVAGARDFELLKPLFQRVVRSLKVDENAVHKPTPWILGRH